MSTQNSILILSDKDQQDDALNAALQKSGFTSIYADLTSFDAKTLPQHAPYAIIAIINSIDEETQSVITLTKTHFTDYNIPVLAIVDLADNIDTQSFDSTLLAPANPEQIAMRINGLVRLAHMEQEITLRLTTLNLDFNTAPDLPTQSERHRFSILFIGKATPEFMVIINALQNENVSVVAAFTSFTAFDYLYEQKFDAVVMNGLGSTEPAYSITETMRKNAKLYHVPALLLVDDKAFENNDHAYAIGFNDIINSDASLNEISARILEQANFHRTHEDLKSKFQILGGTDVIDAETGLFNTAFFNAHIRRLTEYYSRLGKPLSIALIRLRSNEDMQDDIIASAFVQIGAIIKNLVRMEDIPARLNKNLFAIAFTDQSVDQLAPVHERLSSILKCTTVTHPETGDVLDIELEITFNSLTEQETQTSAA